MEEPRSAMSLNKGLWWHFDRYEVRGGFVRPGKGARLVSYDPWEAFLDQPRDVKMRPDPNDPADPAGRRVPAHKAFQRLGQQLIALEREEDEERAILEWCNSYGLPGILLHRCAAVYEAPRWVQTGRFVFPWQRWHERLPWGWRTYEPPTQEGFAAFPALGARLRGETAPDGVVPGDLAPVSEDALFKAPSWALCSGPQLSDPTMRPERLGKTWAPHFPDVPRSEAETYCYPTPLTDRFWRAYAERVQEIRNAAIVFAHMAQALGWLKEPKRNKLFADGHRPTQRIRAEAAIEDLNGLLAGAAPIVRPQIRGDLASERFGGAKLRQLWPNHCLLTSMAVMLALDEAGSKFGTRTCLNCGKPFFPRSQQHVRCTDECRESAKYERKKAARAKRGAAKRLGRRAR
jgi:hypothetical protein